MAVHPIQAVIARARWAEGDKPHTRVLRATSDDGGATLATVENVAFMATRCPWSAAGRGGTGWTYLDAMRLARRELYASVPRWHRLATADEASQYPDAPMLELGDGFRYVLLTEAGRE